MVVPKLVDHDQRRLELSAAVWTIAATRGLHAASLREVAAQAGVSMGTVQHYFGTRDGMIHSACRYMVELAAAGMRELAAGSPRPDSPRTIVRSLALQTLPGSDAERAGAGVWYAFVAHSLLDPRLAAIIRTAWTKARRLVAEQLTAARAVGDVRGGIDPDAAAAELLALIDGLVPRLIVGDLDPDRATALVDAHLDRLFATPVDQDVVRGDRPS